MLITEARAADAPVTGTPDTASGTATQTPDTAMGPAPSATEAFMWNMGLVLVLVVLFYVLLIMPQQKRFKQHRQMISTLKKGDAVVTGGGLVGKIDTLVNDQEMIIDLGNGVKVTALRSTVSAKNEIVKTALKK